MIAQPQESAVQNAPEHRGGGRIRIAHRTKQTPPFTVQTPIDPIHGSVALQAWVDKVYPNHAYLYAVAA